MNRHRTALVNRLEASGKELAALMSQLPDAELHVVPAPNEWTLHQVAAHIRDTEQHAFLVRAQRMCKQVHPQVQGFDQEAYNVDHYSPAEPLSKIISDFRAARRKLIAGLKNAKNESWENWAVHSQYGKINLEWIVEYDCGHTLEHSAQILHWRAKNALKKLNVQ